MTYGILLTKNRDRPLKFLVALGASTSASSTYGTSAVDHKKCHKVVSGQIYINVIIVYSLKCEVAHKANRDMYIYGLETACVIQQARNVTKL